MLQEKQDKQQIMQDLFTNFNQSDNNDSFKNKIIRSDLTDEQNYLESKVDKLFKVLSRIAGGDNKILSKEMQDKLKESGFFMSLVDKLLDLIYSVADKIHGPIFAEGERETLVGKTCSKIMDWTQYGAARNISLSLVESLSIQSFR